MDLIGEFPGPALNLTTPKVKKVCIQVYVKGKCHHQYVHYDIGKEGKVRKDRQR